MRLKGSSESGEDHMQAIRLAILHDLRGIWSFAKPQADRNCFSTDNLGLTCGLRKKC